MRFLNRNAVLALLGVSAPTLWRMVQAGRFPASIRISSRRVGWLEADIVAWVESKRQRDGTET